MEPEALSELRRQDQFLVPVGRLHVHHRIIAAEVDGVDPGLPRPRELVERHLRDCSLPRREEEVAVRPELPHRDHGRHPLLAVEIQEIDQSLALAGPLPLGEVVDLQPVDPPFIGETEEVIEHIRDEDVLDTVVVFRRHADDATPAAPLVPVGVEVDPLHVVRGGERDQHRFILDEVFFLQDLGRVPDLGPPFVTETGGDIDEFLPDLGEDACFACEDRGQPFDLQCESVALVLDLLVLKRRQPPELHLQDGVRLRLVQAKLRHQGRLCLLGRPGSPDGCDDGIDVVERNKEAAEDVPPLLRLCKIELGPPPDHVHPVLEELAHEFLQVQDAGLAVDDGEVDDAEGGLKRRVLVEEVQDNLGRGASLQVDDDPHAVPVRLVADVGDAFDPFFADVAGDILDKARLVHLERDLADDDPRCPPFLLNLHDSPDDALPAPGQVGVPDTLGAHHDPAGGEVRAGHNPHQFLGGDAGLVDDAAGRLADLPEVVGRHVRRHPDRNPARPVDEEVRDPGGEDVGLLERLVEVRDEVDGLLIDICQEFL